MDWVQGYSKVFEELVHMEEKKEKVRVRGEEYTIRFGSDLLSCPAEPRAHTVKLYGGIENKGNGRWKGLKDPQG